VFENFSENPPLLLSRWNNNNSQASNDGRKCGRRKRSKKPTLAHKAACTIHRNANVTPIQIAGMELHFNESRNELT
jgi:hypothetical protein